MKNRLLLAVAAFAFVMLALSPRTEALELVIGEERVAPGIVFIFEGAIKDHVEPVSMHLAENETHVHIEARVNWDEENIPEGTPGGGFVPYLHVVAKVTNEKTGISSFIDLLPHINLVDNFHYARNMALPGSVNDTYSVKFSITPPAQAELALHKDWLSAYGDKMMGLQTFSYKKVDFAEIAKATRK